LPHDVPVTQVATQVPAVQAPAPPPDTVQAVPSVAVGLEHDPVAESQVPATWHWSSAVQTIGVKTQPVWAAQVSIVHELLSLQMIGVWTQLPALGSHESVVQALASSQFFGVPAQVPLAWQTSPVVQARPSSHGAPTVSGVPQ